MNKPTLFANHLVVSLLASRGIMSAALILAATISSIQLVGMAAGDKSWSGIPSTTVLIGQALLAYPMGRLMDRIGRRYGLSLGHLLGITGAALTGWAMYQQAIPVYLAGIFVLGAAAGALDLGRYAAAEASPPDQRGRAIGLIVLGGTLGALTSPLLINLANYVATQFKIPEAVGPWLIIGGLFTLGFALLMVFLRPDPQQIARQYALDAPRTDQTNLPSRSFAEILRDPRARLALGAMTFAQLAMVTVTTITPVHMTDHLHSKPDVVWVMTAHTLGMFGLSVVTGWLADKIGRINVIIAGGLLSTLACLLVPFSTDLMWLAVVLFLLGLGWNFSFVTGSTLLDEVLRVGEKGRGQGAVDGVVNVASGIGSLGSGFVFAATSFALASWITIVIAILPTLLAVSLRLGMQPALSGKGAAD